jgi:DNA mismatch repair protein MutS2
LEKQLSGRFGPQWIIHGHGTGKLRDGVREFLDSYNRKEKYDLQTQRMVEKASP